MRYYQILLEDFKTAAKKYINNGANSSDVIELLNKYKSLRSKMKAPENNIDWWASNRTYKQLLDYVNDFGGIPSTKQMKKSSTGRSHILMENDVWLVVIPLDKDASCFHGRSTDWCTTKPFQPYYENYFYDDEITLIYCIQKSTGNKWAIAAHETRLDNSEYFDRDDNPISKGNFSNQTKLDPSEIISLAFGNVPQSEVTSSREQYTAAIKRLRELFKDGEIQRGQNNLEAEKLLLFTKNQNAMDKYFDIVKPTENYNKNLQRVAVNMVGDWLYFFENPSESVIISALKKDGNAIRYVKNQSEEFKKIAINSKPYSITYMDEPISDELQKLVVTKNANLIRFIKNPSEEIQLLAVSQQSDDYDNTALSQILDKNIKPSMDVINASIEAHPVNAINSLLEYDVKNLPDDIYAKAILLSGGDADNVLRIYNNFNVPLTIPIQISAAKAYAGTIYKLLFVTNGDIDERVQLAGAEENGYSFIRSYERYRSLKGRDSIKLPTERAIELAFKTSNLIEKIVKSAIKIGIKPTFAAFKNAIDAVEEGYNGSIIEILSLSFQFDDVHNKLLSYVKDKAEREDNYMLSQLVKEYIQNNDLDNLKFEPE